MDKLNGWVYRLYKKKMQNAIPNGLIALKGGAIAAEIGAMTRKEYVETHPIEEYFPGEAYFKDKYVVYMQG